MVHMLTVSLSSLRREFDEHKASGSQHPHEDEAVFLKDSCPDPVRDLPQVVAPCQLSLSTPSYRLVAKGQLYNRSNDRTLHTLLLPTHLVKVMIDIAIEDIAPLPVPLADERVFTVFEAVGYIVAWPKSLVTVSDASSLGKSKSSVGKHKSEMTKHSAIKRTPPMANPSREDNRVADVTADKLPQPLVTLERCLWAKYVVPEEKIDNFGFLSLHTIAAGAGITSFQRILQAQYITNAMKDCADGKLFIAPYNTGGHWVLLLIDPIKEIVYYLDSLYVDPNNRPDMKETINHAVLMSPANRNTQKAKSKKMACKWTSIKCPMQLNGKDCGFFVM